METRNKISANCIFVEAYVIYRVIYAKGFSDRVYRQVCSQGDDYVNIHSRVLALNGKHRIREK